MSSASRDRFELALPDRVHVVETLPRDGFQRLEEFVPTEEKVDIIDQLGRTGVDEIEITSFTHPNAVPTLSATTTSPPASSATTTSSTARSSRTGWEPNAPSRRGWAR
jgi:isopropylmalate/homocitrate/citramalate synthase